MYSRAKLILIIAISGLVGGAIGGWLMVATLSRETRATAFEEIGSISRPFESSSNMGYKVAESLKAGDIERAYQASCLLMSGAIHIVPEIYEENPRRQTEVTAKQQETLAMLEELEASGHCD